MVERYFEIDTIKGIAVILMVLVHIFYLSTIMDVKKYNINGGLLRILAVISHTLFIFIVGMNLSISYQKYKLEDKDKYIKKQIKRGLFLLGIGMILSLLTYLAFGDKYIRFGILHFIGVSIILSTLIIHNKNLSLYIASIIGVIYTIINNSNFRNILINSCSKTPFICFITGIANIKYTAIDHFPLIPYFGLICMGIFSGYLLYNEKKRLLFNKEIEQYKQNKNDIKEIKRITRTMNSILKEVNIFDIDFLSLDTEGSELNILKSIDWNITKIKVICVEDNYGNSELHDYLKNLNYKYFNRLEGDYIYYRPDLITPIIQ